MHNNIVMELIYNAALLLSLAIIYEVRYYLPKKLDKAIPVFSGLLIGFIGFLIMTLPFKLTSGIVFDTRSILISVSGLVFGGVPTAIAAVVTIIYRIIQGGAGMYMGIAVITTSALIGLLWRRVIARIRKKYRWLSLYLMGICVHIAMLACTMLIPWPTSAEVLEAISLPVMAIYPVVTVLLGMVLLNQKERNNLITQLYEAEERYRSLFANNYAPMLLMRPEDGGIIDANPAASKFYGWSVDELKGMSISQINTLSQDKIDAGIKQAIREKRNSFVFKHRKASGDIVDVEVYSGPITIKKEVFLYSIIHDISLRTASERALKESEIRFRLLVEGAPDAIFIQTDYKFSFLNKAALRLFGAESADQLIGKSVMDRFHPNYHSVITDRLRILNFDKKAVPPLEQKYIRLDGTLVDVEVTAVPLNYNNADGAVVFVRDISERKRMQAIKDDMEAQLRQQQKLEAIGTLAGGVAHEINNPISGIMNYAELILDKLYGGSEEAGYAREIIEESNRISTIVKDLLQFSRQEKQAHSYASIYDIVNRTISLINTVIKKDQIQLIIEMDEGLPDIKCRSQQIQQVLMNLLTNARDALNEKYTEFHEDKIIRLGCSLFHGENRKWIRLTVKDHGSGIPEHIREKIFEPFFSTKPKELGTGLGLSISFGIVKDHHGKILVDTMVGQYTKFILELPVDNGWDLGNH